MKTLVNECIRLVEMRASTLDSVRGAYEKVAGEVAYCPVGYMLENVDYQLEYHSSNGLLVHDATVVLFDGDRPCGILPLTIWESNSARYHIGSNCGPLLPPLFVDDLPTRKRKKQYSTVTAFVNEISSRLKILEICLETQFTNSFGVDDWTVHLLNVGAEASVSFDLYLEMAGSIEEIQGHFRRRYRSLINVANREWRSEVHNDVSKELWEEFRLLHYSVAGRATRSLRTWEIQMNAINSGVAFFVSLRDNIGRLVGGGLFYNTAQEGSYAVGAYDRSLFDKPVSHLIQFRAIEELKARGVNWYLIGRRHYLNDDPSPTAKEVSISFFKQGFSSHLIPKVKLQIDASLLMGR